MTEHETGRYCHELARELFPISRSLSGPGVRETLEILRRELPELQVHEIASGSPVFDWEVPDEWVIRDAYIADVTGERVVDFKAHNLHVLGYSEPVDVKLTREELEPHLYSDPEQPDWIPYVTSYYKRRWGFCLSHRQREQLGEGPFRCVVDADLGPGVLNYADLVIPGDTDREVLLSTYVCHPSMGNNELSGPVVTTALARWIKGLPSRRHTYRIVFIPETIGSLIYLSRHLDVMKARTVAGFVVTCVGDDRAFSYVPSRRGDTLADRAAIRSLGQIDPSFIRYSWRDRGSDERQYCAPGVDLPVATIARSKYGEYPEYHTSADDLSLISPAGLQGGFDALRGAIETIESNARLRTTVLGEPQLGKRGLYPTTSMKGSYGDVRLMMDLISYCDGEHSLLDIAEMVGVSVKTLREIARPLIANGLLSEEG